MFAVLLFIETQLYTGWDTRCARFSTLIGIIYGLSANIFCRSIIAAVMNQNLQYFDNHISSADNLKWLPVLLGFLFAGAAMHFLSSPKRMARSRQILDYPKHQSFLLGIMIGLFLYLFLNLLLYSAPFNDLLLKLWSIKSCLFCIGGLYIAVRYTRRICELDGYREKNQYMEKKLREQISQGEAFRQQAVHDLLTGLYNRQQAEKTIPLLVRQGLPFVLCFLDLDGLKTVNDRYGHDEGDRYILTVTEIVRQECRNGEDLLFRYGGDEFLILFMGLTVEQAEKRAEHINEKLRGQENTGKNTYPMSLSYGAVDSTAYGTLSEFIQEADKKMYVQKQSKKADRKE
ncbi:GGDEF domain-containing protein [Qiania dongpingensis]|uniref:GGDEF domain-containing protein n=1 Tax=Qiania dongpingensis TaxID=2763669 RepID=UPI002016690D|nr:GGDEF domain-containing protein [Qiania dongpingensis]